MIRACSSALLFVLPLAGCDEAPPSPEPAAPASRSAVTPPSPPEAPGATVSKPAGARCRGSEALDGSEAEAALARLAPELTRCAALTPRAQRGAKPVYRLVVTATSDPDFKDGFEYSQRYTLDFRPTERSKRCFQEAYDLLKRTPGFVPGNAGKLDCELVMSP